MFFREIGENVDVLLLYEFECDGKVMVLQDAFVVVHDGEIGRSVDEELVGDSRMIHVVDGRREDGAHHFQVCRQGEWKIRIKMELQALIELYEPTSDVHESG